MRGDLIIRTVRTASGATVVQIIQYANNKCIVVKHVGSAHTEDELTVLRDEAERLREELSPQLSLFAPAVSPSRLMHMDHLNLQAVTHRFAHEALGQCSGQCGLGFLLPLYQTVQCIETFFGTCMRLTSKIRLLENGSRYERTWKNIMTAD